MSVDFHNHLLPGVDDGATSLDESRAAFAAMRDAGVATVIVTPHFRATMTERPEVLSAALSEIDESFASVQQLLAAEFAEVQLHRGVELMLDSPTVDLSDPRLRLAETPFVLVEFPAMMVPPHSVQALYQLRLQGWRPIIAHPERYRDMDSTDVVDEWRSVGCYLQVNTGSLIGRYGDNARKTAWSLLELGWVDYLSSDYHARGRLRLDESHAAIRRGGGEEQLRLLTQENPSRLLAGEDPLPVPPLTIRRSLWRRLLGRFA